MTKRMLIDATHLEETRVAVVSGNRLEEYDFESAVRRQLKGNIYLVKVTRVEPSLQAAFVDFGGNRHGFLPFPEIHPDYYRIPIADREALIEEERALAAAQAAREDEEDAAALAASGETLEDEDEDFDPDAEEDNADNEDSDTEEDADSSEKTQAAAAKDQPKVVDADIVEEDDAEDADETSEEDDSDDDEGTVVEELGGEDAEPVEEQPVYRSSIKRRYKIQEVIKRGQIMLIQISKEERGNKGAAVTSYISLPGRYCVLMPNSPRGGGVSRKVSNARDRQRLKKILHDLNVPEGMSVILRTAGVSRTKAEIKRDLDYLLRLWDQIRELTMKSTAPALIYEEGNLIKRAIRDIYKRDIDEVLVAGEEGYKNAKEFMKTLTPSHAKRVQLYKNDGMPLFVRYQVETQIDEIHSPTVHLKSGGYIVINPTEALVSIDVNSGRATKGRHIEETALKTNIEASEEIARQLRLRDLGGLVVVDFIDMEDRRNNRIVERKMRDAMAGDRARIQLGRISLFGLLEMSRQRLHPSLVETNFEVCKHCNGVGVVRTVETTAVMILRALEEEGIRDRAAELKVSVPTEIALYLFNNKRDMLSVIEERYDLKVYIHADDELLKPAYSIDVIKPSSKDSSSRRNNNKAGAPVTQVLDAEVVQEADDADNNDQSADTDDGDNNNDRSDRNNRRRGRRGGRRRGRQNNDARNNKSGDADNNQDETQQQGQSDQNDGGNASGDANGDDGQDNNDRSPRRRGRRGGRRRGRRGNRGRDQNGSDQNDQTAASSGDGGSSSKKNHETPYDANQPQPVVTEREKKVANGDNSSAGERPARKKGWWQRLTE